jgi:spermidine synthase
MVMRKGPFLIGVFLITFSLLIFQIVQIRILSVIAWYYLAFFAISVAMLGMTVGAVWVYLRGEHFQSVPLPVTLSNFALATALAMPASLSVQFCLITTITLSLTTVISWSLLLIAMAVPYVFSGVVVSLALTRSPFPTGQVYGVDLLGAALGCGAVLLILNFLDGPTTVIVCGAISGLSALAFSASADGEEQKLLNSRRWWQRPAPVVMALLALAIINSLAPVGIRPILVKDQFERSGLGVYERWNSYSRILAQRPEIGFPYLWGASPKLPAYTRVPQAYLNIDGSAASTMFHYDGTRDSISFLQYDLVNLAYHLPGIRKSAVIGVGGGRDLLSAYLFGVPDITGVELNPIFINLLTRDPSYAKFSNLMALPNLKLEVDDARSWFASTKEKFDLVQMSMIDTWAATGAGAFSLSENGLYTLEGWRAFLRTINDHGIFTVSRWYAPGDLNETGRMIGLATAALLDAGVEDVSSHLFVARTENIATLVLSKSPFTEEQLQLLTKAVLNLGFSVLLAPDQPPGSQILRAISQSHDLAELDRSVSAAYLDLTVPTDNRPFFFNQLRFSDIPAVTLRLINGTLGPGVRRGNLFASGCLMLILFISITAVIATILVPLRGAAREVSRPLVVVGSLFFSLIGMGFMLAEIALLQRFSIYLGHPIYSLGVCLFSLILASGLGSLMSDQFKLDTRGKLLVWGSIVVVYLVVMSGSLPPILQSTTDQNRLVRIGISLIVIMPLGFLIGFAFPTGMRLVEAVDRQPTPWFWGVNGATGVLASVLGVMFSMSLGINVTLLISAVCYLLLIPTSFALLGLGWQVER